MDSISADDDCRRAGRERRMKRAPRARESQQPYLVVVRGQPAGRRFYLREGTTTLGRARGSTIALRDDERILSRIHARIARHGDRVVLRTEGANGTSVNGRALETGARRLFAGDEIELAGRFLLRLCWPPIEPSREHLRTRRSLRDAFAGVLRLLRALCGPARRS